jgi:hypothetical protein
MSENNNDRLKLLQIKLDINMKGRPTIIYSPYMTMPKDDRSSKNIYFMPTIPMNKENVSNALKVIYKKTPSQDDIINVFFSKAEMVNVINKMVEIARSNGTPLFPTQFTSKDDLLGGTISHVNGKMIFKRKNEPPIQLAAISKSLTRKDKEVKTKMDIEYVKAKNIKYGSTITVSNVSLDNSTHPENAIIFEFKNSVKPLTITQAAEKNIIDNNIKFITNLLFNSEQKFYYKGQPQFDYDIFSYSIKQSKIHKERTWDMSSDRNIFAVTVRVRLNPLVRHLDKKTLHKTQQLHGCQLARAEIIRQWYELYNTDMQPQLNSSALVDDPEKQHNQQSNTSQFQRRDINGPIVSTNPISRPLAGIANPVAAPITIPVAAPVTVPITAGGRRKTKRKRSNKRTTRSKRKL